MSTKLGDFVREYLYPLLLIATIGMFGWYVSSQEDIVVTEQRLVQAEKQIEAMNELIVVLRSMQIEIAKFGVWSEGVDKELNYLGERSDDRYPRSEASAINKSLEKRIERLERLQEKQE